MLQTPRNTLELLLLILEELKKSSCNYAIIHNADSLEEAIMGDIDLAFDTNPVNIIVPLLRKIEKNTNIKLVQCLHYDVPHGYYFIIYYKNDYLHLDCLYDPLGISRYHLSTTSLLTNCESNSVTYYVNKNNELIYNIIKRSLKGNIRNNLEKITRHLPPDEKTSSQIKQWIGNSNFDQLIHLENNNIDEAKYIFANCKIHIHDHYRKKHPFLFLYGKACSFSRKIKRFIYPTGLFIVIVGPDGCGKSTINTGATKSLERAFRKTWSFHWRPGLLPKLGKKSSNSNFSDNSPNQKSKYKGAISYLRFIYYWLDFILGYWLIVYPKKAQTTFIISERYYLDILVHPERYGFSCPQWFIKLFGLFVPKPDLVFLLSADPQKIHDRKPELPVDVIAEQIKQYSDVISSWGDSSIIDTSQDIQTSTSDFVSKVLVKCSEKLKRRLNY
ncbi:MAG: hypothetical protein OEY89_03075 [Gammaproteobacteria bacterium]|nr:hypothetical protein [Gammaproteobacteria bacterium]